MAVGACRSHILAQFIFESLLIAFIGGILGMLISWGIVSAVWLFPADDGPMQSPDDRSYLPPLSL